MTVEFKLNKIGVGFGDKLAMEITVNTGFKKPSRIEITLPNKRVNNLSFATKGKREH